MDEYRSFCYLDVQLTGAATVSTFLQEHVSEERVRKEKHGRISRDFDRNKLYFITVREPLDHYLAAYFNGRSGKSPLRKRFNAAGLGGMFGERPEDFAAWLAFMLDPANAAKLGEDYDEAAPQLYGIQTFRHLALAFHKPIAQLKVARDRDALLKLYGSHKIITRVLRYERLNADLRELVEGDLRSAVKDVDAALAALPPEAAASPHADEAKTLSEALPAELRGRLEEREWFIYDQFGYPRTASASGVALGGATP